MVFHNYSTVCYLVSLLFTFQYTTGSIVTAIISEPMPPAKMVTPTGIQNDDCAIIIGTTPTAVVAVVRNIGTIRRLPASKAALRMLAPCEAMLSACSKMRISLRIIIPIRVMSPKIEVKPNVLSIKPKPTNAPGNISDNAAIHIVVMP